MIAEARARHTASNISYKVLDMLEVDREFAPAAFDAVICLGNTLVHLSDPLKIREMLGKIYRITRNNGVVLIQILNYDRILSRNISSLPLLETEHIRFARSYVHRDDGMHFVTRLLVKASGEEMDNDIVLYPLCQKEFADMLREAGFGHIDFFGSFQGGPLTPDSFACIAVARK
jgi:ubiquinone/menaquinone biosynthesis C-methylase UbiE